MGRKAVGSSTAFAGFGFARRGVEQTASGGNTSTDVVTNSGSFMVTYLASASASNALVEMGAVGVSQNVSRTPSTTGSTSATVVNTGLFQVVATATASSSGPNIVLGPGSAIAKVFATGVTQNLSGTSTDANKSALAVLLNTGTFTVSASATAGGTAVAVAGAGAFGWEVNATSGDSLTINGTNTGIFQVQAFAAGVLANALAKGIDIDPGTLNGTITNSGTYVVSATALGAAVLGGASTAHATGIDLTSNSGNVTVINTGKFSVQAAVDFDVRHGRGRRRQRQR